jgi:Alg9-like mannosyltransferase family
LYVFEYFVDCFSLCTMPLLPSLPVVGSASIVLFFLLSLHLFLAPFTKVEESFHLQATHDILFHGSNITRYDHLEFPGVVPRTFLGALTIATIASPIVYFIQLFQIPKIFVQIVVRLTLALLVSLSYGRLFHAVRYRLGKNTVIGMIAVIAITPHFLFYSSRTLPNTFATVLVLNAIADWMWLDLTYTEKDSLKTSPQYLVRSITWFVLTVLWFRCDMLILLGCVSLTWLITRRATFFQLIYNGLLVGIVALGITVFVDSYFWQRWLWPEGVVLFFNTVQNKSHEYGVSPWHWYFTSAIPRGFLATLFCIPAALFTLSPQASTKAMRRQSSENSLHRTTPARSLSSQHRVKLSLTSEEMSVPPSPSSARLGLTEHLTPVQIEEELIATLCCLSVTDLLRKVSVDKDVALFLLPALGFVALYSFLPHKELRFLLPAFPLFHIVAGHGLSKIYRFAEAALYGPRNVPPGPEVVAAEVVAESLESFVALTSPKLASMIGPAVPPLSARRRNPRGKTRSQSPAVSEHSMGQEQTNVPETRAPTPPSRSLLRRLIGLGVFGLLLAIVATSLLASAIFVRVSMDNYPGGTGLQRLYTLYKEDIRARAVEYWTVDRAKRNRRKVQVKEFQDVDVTKFDTKPTSLPPCPKQDVTSSGVWEWARECLDSKGGCPQAGPFSPHFLIDPAEKASVICALPGDPILRPVRVHLDVAACETGVSRFGQSWYDMPNTVLANETGHWIYDKTETFTEAHQFLPFDYLITENPKRVSKYFDVLEIVKSYSSLRVPKMRDVVSAIKSLQFAKLVPEVVTQPALFIMKQKPHH